MAKDKSKKDKKNKKSKEVNQTPEPTSPFPAGEGTAESPFETSEFGPTCIKSMIDYSTTAPEGMTSYQTKIGIVQSNKGPNRTTWKLNGVQIRKETLNNILNGTEVNKDAIKKYSPTSMDPDQDTPPSKVKKSKDKDQNNLLVTEDQLKTKYTKESLVAVLTFKQYGKKKQRRAVEEVFESKKKVKGQSVKDALEEVYSDINAVDLFSIFEALEEA